MSPVLLSYPVADPPSRPLPSIPILGASKPLPLLPHESPYGALKSTPLTSFASSKSVAPSRMRASTRVSLGSVFQEPRILANFLRYIHWDAFQSLALTCTACRNVLQHPNLRDAVLSAFVPGYRYCLRHADDTPKGIDIQFSDLKQFMISQQLPLHHYPTHALAILSASCEAPVLEEKNQRFVMLCQAYSRMVLLLQALIHSSLSPAPDELEDPSLRYRNAAQQGGRELVFPAPLSFFSNNEVGNNHAPKPMIRAHTRFFSLPSAQGRAHRREGDPTRRSLSRLSIMRRNKVPPPPPSADPLGFKLYSGSWRGPRRTSTIPSPTSDDDETLLRRPKLNFAPISDSSRSSTDNSQGSSSSQSTRVAEFLPTSHAPHDIRAATSRLRAPILRVFFPCSEVDQRAISACEAQLDDAGLWQHLSVGDIVCNLGYLPPIEGDGSSTNSDLSCSATLGPESWLIFDGTGLLPYTPSAILPLSEPLSLPSPFYYAHITFPPINPQFIATLPHEEPELSLVLLHTRVRSPHSLNGLARIRKYVWLARLQPQVRPGLGERWHCEWILEGEGTEEGRQSLLDALLGDVSAERVWELIMERSTATRIWLRLMSTMPRS